MSLRDDLIATKALIDTPDKWAKNPTQFSKRKPGMCIVEAVRNATSSTTDHIDCHAQLTKALRRTGYSSLTMFNDARTVTHADIMALFDRAIKAAE